MPSINADQVPKHEHVNFCGETYRISPKMIRNSNPYKPKALLICATEWKTLKSFKTLINRRVNQKKLDIRTTFLKK